MSVKGAVEVPRFASVTSTVKLAAPATVGVPLIAPVAEFSDSPAGSEPWLSVQMYGTVPPVAFSASKYFAEAVAAGSGEVVVITGPTETTRAKDLLAVSFWLSTTWMVKLDVAAVVGVPEICPVAEFNERPAGKVPAVSDQV